MKKIQIYTRGVIAVLIAANVFVAAAACAQNYPSRQIRMIIPAGPGGGIDTVARVVGAPLSTALGQSIIMDNRPGAGTVLGSELTAKAAPDGYTLLALTNSHTINAGIRKDLPYDPIADFAPVVYIAAVPQLLLVHPSIPARNPKELIALAKQHPGQLSFASAGAGTGTHLAFELFQHMAGTRIVHVPYKSGSAALVDLAGGQVQMNFSNTINAAPYVKGGRLRALGITALKRSALFPQVPPIADTLPGYTSDAWYGMVAPARTPPEIVARLNREVVTILKNNTSVRDKLAAEGAEVAPDTPEEFETLMRADVKKWTTLTRAINLKID